MATVSRDTPLSEITLRKYEKPYNLDQRDLVKKLCLSTGLLQPGDSRDVVVDVMHVLLAAKTQLSSEEVKKAVVKNRKSKKLPMVGIASSNVRRQLKRLRDMFFIEKIANNYRVTEKAQLGEIFEEKLEQFLIPSIIARVKDYIKEVDNSFS